MSDPTLSRSEKTTLFYIHGFNSSPQSYKAELSGRWLAEHRLDTAFVCPFLSPYPDQAMAHLLRTIDVLSGRVGFIGSSMGGFYANFLAERYACKAVLVNPAVRPWLGREYLLGQQTNYHTNESYIIEPKHLAQLEAFEIPRTTHPDNIWAMVQTGDEVLDYRQAAEKYKDCQILIEEGGDHSFINFEQHLPDIAAFLFE